MKKDFFNKKIPIRSIAIVFSLLLIATLIGYIFKLFNFSEVNVVILYVLVVLLVSYFTETYIYGFAAAIFSLLAFNRFFTNPYFTLKINDPTNIITFIIMTITTIITTTLTTRVKKANEEALQREAETKSLYEMTNSLTKTNSIDEIGTIAAKAIYSLLSSNVARINFCEDSLPVKKFIQIKDNGDLVHRRLDDGNSLAKRLENLHTPYDINDSYCDFPIYSKKSILAVARIPEEVVNQMDSFQKRMLHAIMENAALALERFISIRDNIKSKEETERERYRANLLRSISHDLRTPLSAIMGTSEMIMSMSSEDDPRYKLSQDIFEDAKWLFSLVENILNLTKLQGENLKLKKVPESVDDVVGVSLSIMEKRMPDRQIDVKLPDEIIWVNMDESLISQVLVNLLDNASKHTSPTDEILLSVNLSKDKKFVEFNVLDRGTGIAEENLTKIFEMFFTTRTESSSYKRGIGIGLAICKTIIEAHGGKIYAENRKDGGAKFTFTLPMEE
jgi:two-component system sensor histidine kinase KdpD